ncbi:hypothetical protein [Myxococcus stipitatus]|uniref:hypothetical protein n=1 Tax=Myxococcus stipitatus TaxID=83455 RepID=UPI0030D4FC6E
MCRLSVALLLLCVSACARASITRSSPPLSVASADLAKTLGYTPWAISMPFGDAEDGSALVLRFLDQAEMSGARFVSDVQVVFMADDAGMELECRRRLMPRSPLATTSEQPPSVGAAGVPAPLQRIRRVELDKVVRCDELAGGALHLRVGQKGLPHASQPRVLSHRVGLGPARDSGAHCQTFSVQRWVTRYAFEDAVGFEPLRVERLVEARPNLRLGEAEAECVPRDPLSPLGNRIEAMAYGGAGPRAAFLGPGVL